MAAIRKLPLHTRIGGRITLVLILVIGFMLMRNCAGSIFYGTRTEQADIDSWYQQGVDDGKVQAGRDSTEFDQPQTDNPLLLKTYRKGFRDGWDQAKQEEE